MKKIVKILAVFVLMLSVLGLVNSQSASAASTFIKPNDGSYTSYFGMRTIEGQAPRMHYGVDIGRNGSTLNIKASAAAKVNRVVYNHSSLGNYIILRHTLGGKTYDTLYGHLSSISVSSGQSVSQGSKIGVMGTTGRSTGVHLHFELHPGGYGGNATAVNPLPYLNGTINPAPPAVDYHEYDGTWAVVKIVHPAGGSTANLFANVGSGIIKTLPVGGVYKVYGKKHYNDNGDLWYDVGPGYIKYNYGEINNHHAVVSSTITTYNSINGSVNRSLSPGTYSTHGAQDGWYNLGANTWVKADQVKIIKNP